MDHAHRHGALPGRFPVRWIATDPLLRLLQEPRAIAMATHPIVNPPSSEPSATVMSAPSRFLDAGMQRLAAAVRESSGTAIPPRGRVATDARARPDAVEASGLVRTDALEIRS